MDGNSPLEKQHQSGNPLEVFLAFLKLGLTSFGGPIAHLGYFRHELVEKRKWVSESQYAQLLAICQFLPGPASSQLGFSLGLVRSGWLGGVAAFIAFTTPSALLLIIFGAFLPYLSGPVGQASIHGLKIVAFAVVSHGVLGMLRQLCPDIQRIIIATLATVGVLIGGTAIVQMIVVGSGALAGIVLCKDVQPNPDSSLDVRHVRSSGLILLILFGVLLVALPILANLYNGYLTVTESFYRAGALVFGGGHVVLPLLEESVVTGGWVTKDQFLAGYGASQAVPGPMFSFSAYLGLVYSQGLGGVLSACIALLSILLPGFLLVGGLLPFWKQVAKGVYSARGIAGVNAAVVGILGAALYDPIFITAIEEASDMAVAVVAFMLLAKLRLSPLLIVAWCVSASVCARLFL